MRNTQDFIDGLNKLNFVKYDNKTLYTKEGFNVSYEIELNGGALSNYPIQFVFIIRKDEIHIQSWGCESNDDNIIANIWWQKKVSSMYALEYNEKNAKQVALKSEFNELIK